MAYLQLEAMDIENVQTQNSLAYIDHNILQQGFENADDHEFINLLPTNTALLSLRQEEGFAIR